MLPFPNRPSLETVRSNQFSVCFPASGTRVISEEYNYETISVAYQHAAKIALTVQTYDPIKLDANLKYSTPSYTFGSVEFFLSGYYVGHAWVTKQRQIVFADGYAHTYSLAREKISVVDLLARVIENGFIPCIDLLTSQPDPNDPNAIIKLVDFEWSSFLIKPKPGVVFYVEAP